jgi:hypothetical protein
MRIQTQGLMLCCCDTHLFLFGSLINPFLMFKPFHFKQFSLIAFGFVCFTVIGTLSHELASIILLFKGFNKNGRPHGDELILALNLHLPVYSIALATAFIGNLVLIWVIFFYLLKQKRVTFMAGGLVGGILGFFLWLVWLGKYILP